MFVSTVSRIAPVARSAVSIPFSAIQIVRDKVYKAVKNIT